MKSLYLAWESQQPQRAWYPIGLLLADPSRHLYRFAYTKGAKSANKNAGLKPLDAFPDFKKLYESSELFPLFQNRILSPDREDFQEYVRQLALSPQASPLEILAVSGGERQTDNLEVFPKIERQNDRSFKCRFLLHGWRLLNPQGVERLSRLKPGDALQVAVELNNPATTLAIQLQTVPDYHMVGWSPRYLVRDLIKVLEEPAHIAAKVVQVNPSPAPSRMRIVVELEGRWPKNYKPMSGPEFQPLLPQLVSRWRSAV